MLWAKGNAAYVKSRYFTVGVTEVLSRNAYNPNLITTEKKKKKLKEKTLVIVIQINCEYTHFLLAIPFPGVVLTRTQSHWFPRSISLACRTFGER